MLMLFSIFGARFEKILHTIHEKFLFTMASKELWISVIITTYNQPAWLEKTLWGFELQSYKNFEVVIADDGSRQETTDLIKRYQERGKLSIQHIWHADDGFKKCEILNKAIVASKYDYLLFTDGDCIPHFDYVEIHAKKARAGYFLSGGYFKLAKPVSDAVTYEDVASKRIFSIKWLLDNGQPFSFKFIKLSRNRVYKYLMNMLTPTKATWNGHNASGWKADIVAVNGYNEDMQYGGLDRELGERLMNNGIAGKQIRYSAICMHLDHPRPYRTADTLTKNREIRDRVKAERITWASNGISKQPL